MKINELLNQNPYISATFSVQNPSFLLLLPLILATFKNKSLYLCDLWTIKKRPTITITVKKEEEK